MDSENLSITHDSQRDWYRNIVSLRVSENLWDDITDSDDTLDAIRNLESAFKPFKEPEPTISRPFEEAEVVNPIADVIEYPFEHPSETRFSAGRYGVWYGAERLETSIHETVYHWRRAELKIDHSQRNERIVTVHRRVHIVGCTACLVDLRSRLNETPSLLSDNYSTCQRLGMELHDGGQPGVITESARDRGHEIVGVFRREALENVRNHCYLSYILDLDSLEVRVERERGRTLLTIQ